MSSLPMIKSREIKTVYQMPISKTLPFWEGLKQGKVYTTKCIKCGKLYFPPTADCPDCLSSNMEWIELCGEAEIETFTHVAVRPMSFKNHEPYTIAIGKLREGVRVLAWLNGFKTEEIKIGMRAKLVGKVTPEGEPTYEYVPL
jgi:uncharacterized protein